MSVKRNKRVSPTNFKEHNRGQNLNSVGLTLLHLMRDTRNASCSWIQGWVALVVVAEFALAPCALAEIYKCTDANGQIAFSDIPCAMGSAGIGKKGVKQEVLHQPTASAENTSPEAISAMCAESEGSQPTDELIESLPQMQRKAVIAALRGIIAGMARDPGAQEKLKCVTLRIDATGNAIICVPRQRAQPSGAPPVTAYTAHQIEPNGRMETLQPGAQPLVYNDANEPLTVAARCSSLVVSCVRSTASGSSIDQCFKKAPLCPSGRLDPALSCCPQACKDAYSRERALGTDAETAVVKVIFGDDAGAASCVPGMPSRE